MIHSSDQRRRNAKRQSALSSLPKSLQNGYVCVPRALLQHAEPLGLKAGDLALIVALWSFKWYAGSAIRPSQEGVAERMGASDRTVRRHTARLEQIGLLNVQRRGRDIVSYDLDSLWDRLDHLVEADNSTEPVDRQTDEMSSGGGQSGRRRTDGVAAEEEEPEVDATNKNQGEGPLLFALGATDVEEVVDGEVVSCDEDPLARRIALVERDIDDPTTFPSTRAKLLNELKELKHQERSQHGHEALRRLALGAR